MPHAPARPQLAIAPMMGYTDAACRILFRLITRRTLLYSEMIVAAALTRGTAARALFDGALNAPVAVQIGGSDPATLACAAAIIANLGYAEVNLNVGCPSARVRSGRFGACLMRAPNLVGECVAAMKARVAIPVTVKCRLGVDDQDIEEALDSLADAVFAAGCDGLWVHARKAWLSGLDPKQNRTVPPLDYSRVYRLKQRIPHRFIGMNGGIDTLESAARALESVDGVMIGRAACRMPLLFADADRRICADRSAPLRPVELAEAYRRQIARAEQAGHDMRAAPRHLMGLSYGLCGARHVRRALASPPGQSSAAQRIGTAMAAIRTLPFPADATA